MKTLLLSTLLLLTLTAGAIAQIADGSLAEDIRTEHLNLDRKDVAISGYDPVSYFIADEPQKGSKDITHSFKGVTYQFTSQENLETFKSNPEKYEPAYGGWCAFAMGKKGSKTGANPKTYKIVDGKLFLFYNRFGINTLPKWNKDEKTLHPEANTNWEGIVSGS